MELGCVITGEYIESYLRVNKKYYNNEKMLYILEEIKSDTKILINDNEDLKY